MASLQLWAGMLYTYIRYDLRVRRRTSRVLTAVCDRWHQGTTYVEKKSAEMSPEDREATMLQINQIKKNRQWGQPYVSTVLSGYPYRRILTATAARVVRVLVVHRGALYERMVRCLRRGFMARWLTCVQGGVRA